MEGAGEGIDALRRDIERAAGLARPAAERLARTAANATATRAHVLGLQASGAWKHVDGFDFIAVLDPITSVICRGLAGRFIPRDDWEAYQPPRHPNCRSVLVPVFHGQARVDPDFDYGTWLARQPEDVQRSILGPTRFAAWRRGVPLAAMATKDRALRVAEVEAIE